MSTRCQIAFYESSRALVQNWKTMLYKHGDGYPEGVLPTLLPFLKDFDNKRGLDDYEYAAAWCLYEFCDKHRTWLKENDRDDSEKKYLSHGICKEFHWDIEYMYMVSPTRIKVLKVNNFDEINDRPVGKVIENIPIKTLSMN